MGHYSERCSEGSIRREYLELKPGDFVNIPAHRRHRVEWTTPDEPTIWFAVFFEESRTNKPSCSVRLG